MGQTYPQPVDIATMNPAFVRDVRFSAAVYGDDFDQAKGSHAYAFNGGEGGAPEAVVVPPTQAAKIAAWGLTAPLDIARQRGWIAPNQPYNGNEAKPVAPVVTSIAPTTGAAAALPMNVVITGTGFTPWSVVKVGGQNTPDVTGKYISATKMQVALFAAVPGTVSIAVEDHDMLSNTNVLFTVT